VPIEAIESIYAIENGIGMMFNHPDKYYGRSNVI